MLCIICCALLEHGYSRVCTDRCMSFRASATCVTPTVTQLFVDLRVSRSVALQATILMILCFLPAACTSSAWFYYRHETWAWVLQDLLSFALCIQILSLVRSDLRLCLLVNCNLIADPAPGLQIRVGSARIASCLLGMMFVYDIFWVFLSG